MHISNGMVASFEFCSFIGYLLPAAKHFQAHAPQALPLVKTRSFNFACLAQLPLGSSQIWRLKLPFQLSDLMLRGFSKTVI